MSRLRVDLLGDMTASLESLAADLETDVEKILDEASALLYEHDNFIIPYDALAMSFKDLGFALSGWSVDMFWHEEAQDKQQKSALL